MKTKMEEEKRRDRITEMPVEIKQQILLCLSTEEALSTRALSSLWRYTWVTLPSLHFGSHFFHHFSNYYDTLPKTDPQKHLLYYTFHDHDHDSDDDYYTDDGCDHDDHDNDNDNDDDKCNNWQIEHVWYMQLLDQIFQVYTKKRQPFEVMTKLSLYVPMLSHPKMRAFASNVVLQWLSLAKHSVQELTLFVEDMVKPAMDSYHAFQNCYRILESKTLTKLELQGCYLKNKDKLEITIDLPCLKHLCLIRFKVDQNMLDILLAKCGALEKLELSLCTGFKVLIVPELSKLKDVRIMDIYHLDRVEINAMALQCLTLTQLTQLKRNDYKVKVASNFGNNLVELFINGCGITDDFFNNVTEFPHLKTLSLIDCPMLKHIKIISKSLTTFHIEVCPNLGLIELDAPKLFHFKYSSTGNNNIITLLSKCPMTRASLHLKRPRRATLDHTMWHSKLVALLANFSQSKHVDLTTNSKKNLIIPQELRESFCPPLCGVEDLSLTVATSLTSRTVLQYLDNLLWLSPNPRTISLSCNDMKSYLSLKLKYEDGIKEGKSCGSYLAQPVNYWRRVFKDFRIVSERGLGNSDSIRKLLEHALNKSKATASG